MNSDVTQEDKSCRQSRSSYHLIIETVSLICFVSMMIYIYFIDDKSLSYIFSIEKYENDFARFLALAVGNGIEFFAYMTVSLKLFEVYSTHKIYVEECNSVAGYYLGNTILAIVYGFIMICSLLFVNSLIVIFSWIGGMIAYCFGQMLTLFFTLPFEVFD